MKKFFKYFALLYCFFPLGLFTMEAQDNSAFGNGKAEILLSTGSKINVGLDKSFDLPLYFTEGDYLPGTRYKIRITQSNYKYIYVIGSDQRNNAGVIYESKNPLNISENSFPLSIPTRGLLEVDKTPGKDYITLLFSNTPLNPELIVEKIKDSPGNYYDKLTRALGNDLLLSDNIRCIMNKIGFISFNTKKVVPVTFEIKHKE